MANRDLNFSPTVTDVTPQMPQDAVATAAFEVGDQIAHASAQAKALQATAATQLAFRQLDGQYRMATAGNPNDPEALKNLQASRAEIVSSQGENVPSIAMRDYQNKAIELGQASDASNQLWATKQQMRNAVSDMQTSRTTFLNEANMSGKDFATQGPDADTSSFLNYMQANASIHQFADPVIGKDKAAAYLREFNTDYVKSFVAGVAENNPQKAAALLQDPAISTHFTSQDVGDMADLIKRTTRQQQLIQSEQLTSNDSKLTDLVNDPNSTYYEKRSAIDQMDMEGNITPKAAASARRVIKSSNDLDAQTDTPVMTDIINKAYDLNANATYNSDDYLLGVRNLQQQVMDAQGSGSLTAPDAKKLASQITNLTNAKMAAATQTAGNEFYDANQTFNALPPEYRGQATRALFYAGYGQNWSPEQYKNQATQIMQQISDKRRQAAMDTLNSVQQSDTDFLKTVPNASPEAISATAKKYGISEAQVIQKLRADAVAKARAKAKGVKRTAPQGDSGEPDEGPSPGIKLKEPAPPSMQEDEYDDGTPEQ